MTTTKTRMKDVQEDLFESAHKVWLAGLGALSTVEEEGSRLFQQLVDRGRDMESRGKEQAEKARSEVESKVRETKGRMESTLKEAKSRFEASFDDVWAKIDERLTDAMRRFGVPTRDEIQTLTRRVEDLNRKIDRFESRKGTAKTSATETATKVYHVTTHEEGWKVEAEGASRATSVHPTKEEAVQAARELGESQAPCRVVVHKMDGTIQTQYSYEPEVN